jgi:uncharacterized membrane protein
MKTTRFLHQLDHERVLTAIREAEARSRGEVRVHVSNQTPDDVQKAAAAQFERLGMTATALRNGVLIYVAPPAQQFAVIGDLAIHERGGPGFWAAIAQAMEEDFRAGRFTDGIVKGVERAGDALATHFPRTDQHDVNELSDQVTED